VDEGPARQKALTGLASVREKLRLDEPSTAADRVAAMAAGILEAGR
jgi:hypothetical protein